MIHAASSGDSEAMGRVLRYYDDYMTRLCTRTLYDKDGTPHVCVDTHMKRCLETQLDSGCRSEITAPAQASAGVFPFCAHRQPGLDSFFYARGKDGDP